MRRTLLSVDELFKLAMNGDVPASGCGCGGVAHGCFYANELGQVFKEGNDEERSASREALINLLSCEEKKISAVSYCYLRDGISRETDDMDLVTTVALFRNDPKNAEVMRLVEDTVSGG